MEGQYPTLRRPRRKLCYLTNRENAAKQWEGKLSIGDVDRMFDDLDSFAHVEVLPPSLLLEVSDGDKKHEERDASVVSQEASITEEIPECPMVAEEVVVRTASPKPTIDLDVPFKGHGPIKTSSPIEGNVHTDDIQEDNKGKDELVSPILFVCEDEEQEKAKAAPPTLAQEPQGNNITEKCEDSELESPPSKVVISRPKSSQKEKKNATRSEVSPPVKREIPQTRVFVRPSKTPRCDQKEHKEPEPEKDGEPAVTTNVGKDLSSFLQKLKDTRQQSSQPPVLKKLVSPVKVPTPPREVEEDFVILEDDAPLWVSIPSKTATRQKKNKTSSTDKDSSTDKSTKESVEETTQKQPEVNQTGGKHGDQAAGRKIKKTRLQASGGSKETASLEDVEEKVQEQIGEEQTASQNQECVSDKDLGKSEAHSTDDSAKETAKQSSQPAESEGRLPEDNQVLGKRKRTLPGKWWRAPQSVDETQARDALPVLKKSKQTQKEPRVEATSPVEEKIDTQSEQQSPTSQSTKKAKKKEIVVNKIKSTRKDTQKKAAQVEEPTNVAEKEDDSKEPNQSPTSQSTRKAPKKKIFKNKNKTTKKDAANKKKAKVDKPTDAAEQEQPEVPDIPDVPDVPDVDSQQSSPLEFPHRDHSHSPEGHLFHRTYDHSSTGRTSRMHISPIVCSEQDTTPELGKRRRKPPGNWWRVDNKSEDEMISSGRRTLQPKKAKRPKQRKTQTRQTQSPEPQTPTKDSMLFSSTPLEGAATPPFRQMPLQVPKTVKSSLATFKDIFTSHTKSTLVIRSRKGAHNVSVCSAEGPAQVTATDHLSPTRNINVSTDNIESNHASSPESRRPSQNTLTVLRSGPSSMIDRGEYEDTGLQPSRVVHAGLSVSDLCAPPLKPLSLQAKDKANLTEWFKTLWSSAMNDSAEITPDHFDWYFYQGRAIGIQEDLCCESISNGKLLLGSNMKKPLWVDHSATTVFNILTGSVCVSIDCTESVLNPGQSFMVQLGHAYSIQNLTAQPAVLYFTRIAESKDEAW